ncbi:Protein LSM14 -like protein B-B [Toxocara canis]|uniref:Protein LSM14-like protein B-B n=1 Tax=Toxocara canis TaxID=6265 RepID=A0A0B2V6L2_TOXCA|nr:Protein LSM14 -like protein B-B [Toxocara canis]
MTQQTPYIGSKISLISKLDIRYEGILYTVDTNESTIALAKVRSFGTEDRPTSNPVPARNDVYDYIIFKASDIKDLIVCDTPKPVAQLSSGLPYDPAILTVSSQSHVLPPQPAAPVSNANLISAGSSRSETPTQLATSGEGQSGATAQISRAPGAGRAIRSGSLTDQMFRSEQQQPGGGFQQQKIRPAAVTAAPIAARAPPAVGTRPPAQQQNYRNISAQQGTFAPAQNYRGGQKAGSGYYQRGHAGGYSRGQRGGAMNKAQSPKERFKYDTDYDFEKANEQFQETLNHLAKDLKKTKLEEGGSEESNASDTGPDVIEEGELNENGEEEKLPTTYYDKSSSFFDRISCEALEKQEGKQPRTDWRKERETNQQTFGHSAVRSLAYRRGRGFQAGRNMRGGNAMFRYNNGYNYGGQRAGFNYYQNGYHRRGGYRNNFVNQ